MGKFAWETRTVHNAAKCNALYAGTILDKHRYNPFLTYEGHAPLALRALVLWCFLRLRLPRLYFVFRVSSLSCQPCSRCTTSPTEYRLLSVGCVVTIVTDILRYATRGESRAHHYRSVINTIAASVDSNAEKRIM